MPSFKTFGVFLLEGLIATATPVLQSRAGSRESTCTWTEPKLSIAEAMTNWIELWQGNRSEWLVDHTMVPSVSMWTDRRLMSGAPDVPGAITVPVEVTDSESMMDWMTSVGTNYTYLYHFNFTDPTGRMLVARWTLFGETDTPIGARGEPISMNGTDIFEFDECSGRISQVMTAQDILHFAYQKGINIFTKK